MGRLRRLHGITNIAKKESLNESIASNYSRNNTSTRIRTAKKSVTLDLT
jgi:hypothetical protein